MLEMWNSGHLQNIHETLDLILCVCACVCVLRSGQGRCVGCVVGEGSTHL